MKIAEALKLVNKSFVTVENAAQLRGVSRASMYQLIERGRIETHSVMGKTAVLLEDLKTFTRKKPGRKSLKK